MDWNEIASVSVTLFLVMDPLGNVPIFHSVLSRLDPARRQGVIIREMFIALGILLVVLFAGKTIFAFLGLSESSLSIAGGILLFIISLRMIFPGRHHLADVADVEEPLIVPLATPMVAGPSTIALLMLLSSSQPDKLDHWLVALLLAWLASTLLLAASSRLFAFMGVRGARALERLMGMILVILATQMLLNGIRDFIETLSL